MAKHLRPEGPVALTPRPQTSGTQGVGKEIKFPVYKVLGNMSGQSHEVRRPYLAWNVRKLPTGARTPKLGVSTGAREGSSSVFWSQVKKKILKFEAALSYMVRSSFPAHHLHVTYGHSQGHLLSHTLAILSPQIQKAVIALNLHSAGMSLGW